MQVPQQHHALILSEVWLAAEPCKALFCSADTAGRRVIYHLRKLIIPLPASVYTAGEIACMDICKLSLKSVICMHTHFQFCIRGCCLLQAVLHANLV